MIFIFGGAYQGKLEYAKQRFGGDVYQCKDSRPSFDGNIIDCLEKFVFACVKDGVDAVDYLRSKREKLAGKVIICDDVSQGIVPIDREERAFREANGRVMIAMAKEAEEVIRIFCGLPHVLKSGEDNK